MELEQLVVRMKDYTDCIPWYWRSVGDKCYAFDVVEAFPLNEKETMPPPGSQLEMNDDGQWVGSNGTQVMINSIIAEVDQQNGGTVCGFIAAAHAHLLGDAIGVD